MISLKPFNEAWSQLQETFFSSYKIGPFTVRISSNSASLAHKFIRAFSHLEEKSSPPDLTIRVWENAKLPPLDWNLIHSNGYRGYQDRSCYLHYFEAIGTLSAVDVETNIAYYAVQDAKTLPWWVFGSPFQAIFHVWLREKGIQLTHSASISNGKKGILLAGKGGSGKSTTVLSCLQEGLFSLGEDYLLLAPQKAYSVYQTAKLTPQTRNFFPQYNASIVNPELEGEEKALLYYQDLFPLQLEKSSSLDAVVSLRVGPFTDLQPSNLATSLQGLLLTTAFQLPHTDSRTASLLTKSLSPLPHYRLTLGPDLKANVAALRELLH